MQSCSTIYFSFPFVWEFWNWVCIHFHFCENFQTCLENAFLHETQEKEPHWKHLKMHFFRGNRKIDTDRYYFLSIVYFKVLSFTKVSLCWWRDYSGRNSFVVSLSAGTMKLVWTLILLYVNKSFNDNPKQKFYSDDGDFIPMWSNNFEMQKGIQMKTFLSSCSLIKKLNQQEIKVGWILQRINWNQGETK